jgi:UTP--glucose-1-phosphate uridylyltransferase
MIDMPTASAVKKAIFPVGGLGVRFLPATKSIPKEMLPVVDKPLIQYAVEEAAEAGVEEFIFVTNRGKSAIENHFDYSAELEQNLHSRNKKEALTLIRNIIHDPGSIAYIRQQEPAGLGHAIWCARNIVGDEPVAILLADDLIQPATGQKNCLAEMTAVYGEHGGNMVAIMDVPREDTSSYGIITPGKTSGALTEIKDLVEKPKPEDAPSQLAVVGRYIIEAGVFAELSKMELGVGGEIQLTDSLARRIGKAPFHGVNFSGTRFDCGSKIGFLQANIAFALARDDLAASLTQWLKALKL